MPHQTVPYYLLHHYHYVLIFILLITKLFIYVDLKNTI